MPSRLPLLHRFSLLLRYVTYTLRGGFLVRPLAIALALGAVGAGLSALEEAHPTLSRLAPHFLFPSHSDPQVAQVILGGIAAAMMTVVSIVFAILLMTLTLASMQFSPRIIVSFSQDTVTQQTLGIFLGTFTYCIAALPAAHTLPHPFEPVWSVLGAMLLALACVGWLLFFIHHISEAISVNHIVDRIAQETEAIIDETMPLPRRESRLDTPPPPEPSGREDVVLSGVSGYVRFLDSGRLVALAKSYGITVVVLRRVGHFVPAGVPLLEVSRGDKVSPHRADALRGTFDLGATRTLQQDVEFGILQIVDIALKAISPAVNDPSTGITCVDQLSRILIKFAAREPPAALLYDPPDVARAAIPRLGFERLLDSAFEQIRLYARADVAVSLRLLRALSDIAATVSDPAMHQALAERGRRIVSGCAGALGEDDLGELRARLAFLEAAAPVPEE